MVQISIPFLCTPSFEPYFGTQGRRCMCVCLYVGGLPIIQYPTFIGEIIYSTMTDAADGGMTSNNDGLALALQLIVY